MVDTAIAVDVELVRNLLHDEFDNITLSTDPDRTVDDFEKHRPEVLVLAFNSLENARVPDDIRIPPGNRSFDMGLPHML